MITRIDDTEFRRKLQAMARNGEKAGVRATAVLAGQATKSMTAQAEQKAFDTGRYLRATQMQHNDVAAKSGGRVASEAVVTVRESKRGNDIRKRFKVQYEKWTGLEKKYLRWKASYEARPGHEKWPSYRKLLRTLDKVGDVVDRLINTAAELNAKTDAELATAIVIGGKRTQRPGLTNLLRVDTKLYGGKARLWREATRTMAELRNMEPHARIVEARLRIGGNAVSNVKGAGLKRAGKAYIEETKQGTGMKA